MDEQARRTWAEWLNARLDERGWRQADLVHNSDGEVKRDRVSKWVNGKEAPSHRMAVIVANTLGEPQADALRAAGFDVVDTPSGPASIGRVESLEESLADIVKQLPAGSLRGVLQHVSESDLIAELQRRIDERALHVAPVADDDFAEEDFDVTHENWSQKDVTLIAKKGERGGERAPHAE